VAQGSVFDRPFCRRELLMGGEGREEERTKKKGGGEEKERDADGQKNNHSLSAKMAVQ